jgi:hypothetical protein
MIDVRPLGIEEYAQRHNKPLSSLHEKLWLETYSKTRSPEMMVGPLEGGILKNSGLHDARPPHFRNRHVYGLQHFGVGRSWTFLISLIADVFQKMLEAPIIDF